MRVLLLADLHANRGWFRWITAGARDYDLVCIAGDLLDMFGEIGDQIAFLREEWLPQLQSTGVPLAVCTGNHDFSAAQWLSSLNAPRVIGDGHSRLLFSGQEQLVITTCPYFGSFSTSHPEVTELWEAGAALRTEHRAPWLVLHHEPPPPLSPSFVINQLATWIDRCSPELVSCGHFHDGPEVLGRFGMQIGRTYCFNAGYSQMAIRPNHVVLDTSAGIAAWHGPCDAENHAEIISELALR